MYATVRVQSHTVSSMCEYTGKQDVLFPIEAKEDWCTVGQGIAKESKCSPKLEYSAWADRRGSWSCLAGKERTIGIEFGCTDCICLPKGLCRNSVLHS